MKTPDVLLGVSSEDKSILYGLFGFTNESSTSKLKYSEKRQKKKRIKNDVLLVIDRGMWIFFYIFDPVK